MKLFKSKKPQYEYLRKKWLQRHKEITQRVLDKHFRKAAISSLGGLILLTTPGLSLPAANFIADQVNVTAQEDRNALIKAELLDKLPHEMRNLSKEEETKITDVLSKDFGIKVTGELEGKRLNRTYGLIGGEQHLYRYPGDNLFAHAKTVQDFAMYGDAGIAPGLGAWGYFAPSKAEFTQKDEERERYYIAVQTFLSSGFAERFKEYRDFFKFRKMLLANPKTGQSVVAVIGDAGPAQWTGKHLGGSPEVMQGLGLASGPRKGPVLYFFIDDPEDQVPLGPIKIAENAKLAVK
ncbi:hypothetical protein HYW46_04925 [Candidatus Daviesbacteria bacterium]|nr:hypothetical protein [Candidatus Daviesbacteria bacterium]